VTIAARLLLGFLVSVLLLMAVGFFGLDRIGVVRDTTEAIVTHDIWAYRALQGIVQTQVTMIDARRATVVDFMMQNQHLGAAGATGASLGGQSSAWLGSVGGASAANLPAAAAHWKTIADNGGAQLDNTIAITTNYEQAALAVGSLGRADGWHEITDLLQQAQAQFGVLRADSMNQFAAMAQGNLAAVIAAEPKLVTDNIEFGSILGRAEDALQTGSSAGEARIAQLYQESRVLLVWAIIVALIVSIGMAYSILRSIVRPLENFIAFAERVGQGDLTGEPLKVGRDELGRLGATLNSMSESLRQIGRQSREITTTLNASAAQIRASTQQQAASVEEQLAALQQTAATAVCTEARAQEVIHAAQASVQTSANGLRAVAEAARAMDAIRDQGEIVATNIVALSEKTQAIGEIIMTVNDISERSHLLALNAAIEAAAAGENGRSFAVVASELKVLADQAKEATLQVRSILGEIQRGINTSVMLTEEAVKRVAVGRERSDVTERTIEEITASVQESVQTFQQIVASTNQQQIGIEQVMGALQNIRQASQQTAAGTRELDTAAGNLADLSRQLMVLGERYKV
jgi:methyl-accepting chemotaxis protein